MTSQHSFLPSDQRPVPKERSQWRDLELSLRHRDWWGFNCPAVDLDFLMVEYNSGKPAALVEYKHYWAKTPNLSHPSYRALDILAGAANLPFLLAYYWPDIWAFQVHPINDLAKHWFRLAEPLSEREYVTRLYRIRNRVIMREILEKLNTEHPPTLRDVA